MSRSLARTPVLLVDVQSTGANPARGHLLEVAWCRTRAADLAQRRMPPVVAHLVALPDDARLPRRISALTGIAAEDLGGALAVAEVHARWDSALAGLATGDEPPVVVAHFARFERAFLDDLCQRLGGALPDVSWVCTHDIACRLLPDLPHRGLRAVAGHLGHPSTEVKRAAEHVAATAVVWNGLVAALRRDAGVTTLDALRRWTAATPPRRRAGRGSSVDREARLALPDAPGVYRMLGRSGQLLYVGKATSLRTRVNGYFQKRRHGRVRARELLTQVVDVDVTETASPLEAALLEADLIKEHAPPYNVALRERERALWYADADLREVSESAPSGHALGPLPRREAPDAWVALAAALRGTENAPAATLVARAIGLPDDAVLDPECASEGLAAFVAAHGLQPGPAPWRRRLLGLGARSWRTWRAAQAEAAATKGADDEGAGDAAPGKPDDDDAPREPWVPRSPEQVARMLEGTARQAAHLARRGAWLRRLADCSLVWRPATRGTGAPCRALTIHGGQVDAATDVPAGAEPPAPRPPVSRDAACRDVATYDRLRVLTTELRRLVAAGGPVELRLDARCRLDREALARRLFWV